MLLKDLQVGDRFYHKSQAMNTTPIFEVVELNIGIAKKIRCKNLKTDALANKLGNLEVIKKN